MLPNKKKNWCYPFLILLLSDASDVKPCLTKPNLICESLTLLVEGEEEGMYVGRERIGKARV